MSREPVFPLAETTTTTMKIATAMKKRALVAPPRPSLLLPVVLRQSPQQVPLAQLVAAATVAIPVAQRVKRWLKALTLASPSFLAKTTLDLPQPRAPMLPRPRRRVQPIRVARLVNKWLKGLTPV